MHCLSLRKYALARHGLSLNNFYEVSASNVFNWNLIKLSNFGNVYDDCKTNKMLFKTKWLQMQVGFV